MHVRNLLKQPKTKEEDPSWQPCYVYNLLQVHQPSPALRSSTQQLLCVPYMSFGRHTFSYSSPATWISIPTSIKNRSSPYSLKRHSKSHVIAQLINNWCTPSGHLATSRASDSCLMLDYVCIIHFCIHYYFFNHSQSLLLICCYLCSTTDMIILWKSFTEPALSTGGQHSHSCGYG